eukprot:scaffold5524_cov175-Amphora_coffeaeformis.AAC.2
MRWRRAEATSIYRDRCAIFVNICLVIHRDSSLTPTYDAMVYCQTSTYFETKKHEFTSTAVFLKLTGATGRAPYAEWMYIPAMEGLTHIHVVSDGPIPFLAML